MSIIIENKEDIELLLEFFKLFDNSDKTEAQNDDDLRERINQIDKWKVEQSDAKKNLAKTLLKVDLRVKKIEEFLDKDVAFVKVDTDATAEEINVPAKTTYRKYSKECEPFTNIKGLNEDGTFSQKRGKKISFTIQDILKLKRLIPETEEYPNFKSLEEIVQVNDIPRICHCIEIGFFDEYLNEWEQIQANQYYGNWKPNSILNNPQKRKENGMV